MTTLNLTLRGLCGLVPDEFVPNDPDPGRLIRHMRVLVLDAAHLGQRVQQTLCPHLPRLIIGFGGNAQTVPLAQHNIRIEGLDPDRPIQLQSEFWDLAHMNDVTPEPFNVDKSFLQQNPVAGIVASLRVTDGVAGSFDRPPQVHAFGNPSNYRKRFARAVRLRLQLNGQGRIHLTRFDGSNPLPPIDLVPNAEDSVDVTLTNLCNDDPQDMPSEGADFAAFYGLLPSYDGPLFVPVDPTSSLSSPLARGEVRAEASGPQTGCVPAVYNAHPDA
ncbi:MAG TPA: hypothetical protein VKK31_13100 [Thermoanaerobaculia bacterium]|nr:hypothetical protein [Thermoanaerobaculia bacterium]